MTSAEPVGPGVRDRARAFLAAKDRILSLAILAAIVVPVVAVAAQVRPATSGLAVAPDFRMWDTRTYQNLGLSDFRGKVVFLDIMASWCITCKYQMPDLKTINDTYDGDSFVLLSVSGDWNETVEKMEYYRQNWWRDVPESYPRFTANWTFALPVSPAKVAYDYQVTAFPTTVIIDRDGLMTYRAVGRVPLATLVAEVEATLNA